MFFLKALNRIGVPMGSLGHRALLQYVDANDLSGLRALLDSRHLTVDDRDEVNFIKINFPLNELP